MSYTLGQQVVLTTLVTDPLGVPTNATMSLVVTRPDGSTSSPSISNPSTGNYSSLVPTPLPNTYLYLWTASGAAIGVDDGQFEVLAITRRIASLAALKLHMNKNNTADDVELQDFLDAAQSVVQREIGPVVPTSYTELFPVPYGRLVLTHRPVISITSLTEYASSASPVVVAASGYRLDGANGIVERMNGNSPSWFNGGASATDISVTYLAGRTGAVPMNIQLGTLELAAHLYRNTQQGRARRRQGSGPEEDTPAAVALGFSLPNRVRELIGGKRGFVF